MDVMNSPVKSKNKFSELLEHIRLDYPNITFLPADNFQWSSKTHTVFYNELVEFADWSLLHELGHMLSEHSAYHSDGMLVRMEVEAWDQALKLAKDYSRPIDEDYMQDCIDSYRSWQFQRSMCPKCSQTGLEKANGQYRCINCRNSWKVTTNRFCRVYRRQEPANRKDPS
jgi:hypothetical protein